MGVREGSPSTRDGPKPGGKSGRVDRPTLELPDIGALSGASSARASPKSAAASPKSACTSQSARSKEVALARRLERAKLWQGVREAPRLTAWEKESEMRHFLASHRHDERLQDSAGRQEEAETHVQGRLRWRHEMDRSLKRLMVDMEWCRSSLPPESARTMDFLDRKVPRPIEVSEFQNRLASDHTDRVYRWYNHHGNKQARKELEGPAFVRFDPQARPIPGSLRIHPGGSPRAQRAPTAQKPVGRLAQRPCTSSDRMTGLVPRD